jgi:hypothetical protein
MAGYARAGIGVMRVALSVACPLPFRYMSVAFELSRDSAPIKAGIFVLPRFYLLTLTHTLALALAHTFAHTVAHALSHPYLALYTHHLMQLRDAGLVIWNGGLRTTAVCPISLTVYHHSYAARQ